MKFPKLAILEKEMSRAEFLKSLGLGALLVAGGSTIAKLAMPSGSDPQTGAKLGSTVSSYGSSAYGGRAARQ